MGFALPGVNATFGLPPGALGATMLLSATFAGMLVGAPFWGRQADVYGRRPVFLITVLAGVIFGLVGAMAPNIGCWWPRGSWRASRSAGPWPSTTP